MLGATVTFPAIAQVDPNAGLDWTVYDASSVNALPLRSTPLYGDSLQYATDALKSSAGTNYTGIIIAAIAAIVVWKVM